MAIISRAHDGEEHDAAPVAQTNGGQTVQSVRSGEYELTLKYGALVPEREATLRLFITRYADNQPVKDAAINAVLTGTDGAKHNLTMQKSALEGQTELKMPPLAVGSYHLQITTEPAGEPAEFGALEIAPAAVTADAHEAAPAHPLVLLAGLLVFAGLTLVLIWHFTRRNSNALDSKVAVGV